MSRLALGIVFAIGLLNLTVGYVESANSITSLGPTMPPPCPDSGCIH